jgi:hypothetical protein
VNTPTDDEARLERAHRDRWDALVDRDTDRLAALLADGDTRPA